MARAIVLVLLFFLLLAVFFVVPLLFPQKAPAPSAGTQKPASPPSGPAPQIPGISPPPQEKPAPRPQYNLSAMELRIHALINAERLKNGLAPLEYNDDVAKVARGHSEALARENANLTDASIYCPDIFIHHEGFETGLYQEGRLMNASIYYFNASGENIFMTPGWSFKYADVPYAPCEGGTQIVEEYDDPADVLSDLAAREKYAKSAVRVNWTKIDWVGESALEAKVVQGWLASPGHRANVLEPSFGEEGIGIAEVNEFIIVTEVFIERTDCGFIGAACCVEGDYGYCYEPWACDGANCS